MATLSSTLAINGWVLQVAWPLEHLLYSPINIDHKEFPNYLFPVPLGSKYLIHKFIRPKLPERKTPLFQVRAKETFYYFTIKMYFVLPYHNNKRLLQAIFILYLLFYEVIQSKFFLVGKFDTRQENGSRYLWRKRTGWRWWRGERSKEREK
jgi:hypothetical protein